ncbi:wdhd1 [Symbiodinium necroappetens]|uniref:Wdhd1 protein n=1 Tax=Symbiodinium necroappetens TaxID=1628268 RepID=A0A812ZKE5_9DINO|nr:wdhd1 [Symbiodinium necroappetens]
MLAICDQDIFARFADVAKMRSMDRETFGDARRPPRPGGMRRNRAGKGKEDGHSGISHLYTYGSEVDMKVCGFGWTRADLKCLYAERTGSQKSRLAVNENLSTWVGPGQLNWRLMAVDSLDSEKAGEPDITSEDVREAEETEEQLKATLDGAWQQLEGTARAPSHPRFLVWNGFGHVANYPDLLRIEVCRSGDEKPVGLQDYDGVQMAAMSEGALCLAARSTAAGGSRVLIRPTHRWEKALFSAPISDENPEALACGEDFVAVITSSRLLRLFSFSGLPLGMRSLPGPGVALAARGKLLLLVTRPPGTDEDEELDFRLLDVKTRMERAGGLLPLSEGARLRWIGISTDFVPLTLDTSGVLRALLGIGAGSWGGNGLNAEWTPVLSLADEVPLWVVDAPACSLCVVELLENREPWPRPQQADDEDEKPCLMPFFGVGGTVAPRRLPWRMTMGSFPAAGEQIEAAFREQLLLRHFQDMLKMDMLSEQQQQEADALEKRCKSRMLKLFTQLAKSDEVERAHHVAGKYLAKMEGTAKVLEMARTLAEKAKQHKLADEIAALLRPASVPRVELPPLFKPGEFEDAGQQGADRSEQMPTGSRSPERLQTGAGEGEVLRASAAVSTSHRAAASSASSAPSAPSAPSNPFARKRPGTVAGGRQPATPMASGGNASSKVARLT